MMLLAWTSFACTVVLTGFNVDRTVWDYDAAHLGDYDSLRYVSIVTLVAYIVSLACEFVLMLARGYFYCTQTPNVDWVNFFRGKAKPTTQEWIEEARIWSAANSIALTSVSLATLSFDRYWDFLGSYNPSNLAVMIGLTACLLVLSIVSITM